MFTTPFHVHQKRLTTSSSICIDLMTRSIWRIFYHHVETEHGRRYQLGDLDAPGNDSPSKGNPHYEFLGVKRYWRYSKENMEKLQGRAHCPDKTWKVPRLKRYLDEGKGVPLGSVWDDLARYKASPKSISASRRKNPCELLERIIEISPNAMTWCSTRSVDVGRRLRRRKMQDGSGLGSTSRLLLAA